MTTDVPEAVKNLKLKWAFKNVAKPVEDCYTVINDKEFFIEDDESSKRTVVVRIPNEEKYCKVINSYGTEAVVLSIDNALIMHHPGGIADGAVFNMENFFFVEFKTNAQGNSDMAVNATYRKAMEQLKSTIGLFDTHLQNAKIEFTRTINVVCNIVISSTFPKNMAAEMTYALEFAHETNGIPLTFENIIEL